MKLTVTKEEILTLMEYDPRLGLIWKVRRGRFAFPGSPVGGKGRGQVRLNGTRVYSSHIVWFLHNGYWPSERNLWIDHRNGDLENELIENLRTASPSQNNANRSIRKNKPVKGVYEVGRKYRAVIQFQGKKFSLGNWETEAEAAAAYEGASRVLHGEFSVFVRNEELVSPAPLGYGVIRKGVPDGY